MTGLRAFGSRWGAGALGLVAVLALWWIAGVFAWFKGTIPTPFAVLRAIGEQGSEFYSTNFTPTIELALRGFLWGNLLAIVLALLVVIIPLIEGVYAWFKGTIPTPFAVLRAIGEQGSEFYSTNFTPTIELALRGFLWGNLLAIVLALLVVIIPLIEGLATQLAIISYCTPLIAVAPIVQVAFAEVQTMIVFLAAISVFFTTMIGTLTGLRSPQQASLDLVRVYGGGAFSQLVRIRLIAAVPNILGALKIAAPAAVLGAVLGEFLSMPEQGIGPALILAQQQAAIPQVWAIALLAGVIAGIGYAIVSLVSVFATRWSTGNAVLA